MISFLVKLVIGKNWGQTTVFETIGQNRGPGGRACRDVCSGVQGTQYCVMRNLSLMQGAASGSSGFTYTVNGQTGRLPRTVREAGRAATRGLWQSMSMTS